jgi:RNA polymerase sigma factor (sigma-70 family)
MYERLGLPGFTTHLMSTSQQMQKASLLLPIPPLTSLTKEGKPYVRSEAVIAEIHRMSDLDPEEWLSAAPGLKSETIVYIIRRCLSAYDDIAARLMTHLGLRTFQIAYMWIHGAYEAAREMIQLHVDLEIKELLLAKTVSRQSEALEVAFGQAVARRTTDEVRRFRNSALGHARQIISDEEDAEGERIEDPVESIPDKRPGAHEIVAEAEHANQSRRVIEEASVFVTDPRHRKAVRLKYLEGWSIQRIAKHFKISDRQARNWKYTAVRQMKEGLNRSGDDRAQYLI